ncbi:MAG TPA: TAXI family TRAP transporter solute-binding subunit [candidate division Zixibacteria bacterium]|nr:TAXI family TRAP transporter solute-binding subunit [candidate division Zixibacteria bacterium]
MKIRGRAFSFFGLAALFLAALFPGGATAQVKTRISIATGGTGGVYYPLGGGLAAVISKYLPGVEATAEVTTASVDNMKLLHANRVALAFTLPDTAWDAYQGKLKGLGEKVQVRALAALYSNFMHIVALEGGGIKSVPDLKGKRVSTGAPGSGTEVKGLRVMEAYGLTPRDLKSQDRLGVAESAAALKDRKIDAFIWDGGLPTAAILDLAATPGIRIHLVPHGDAVAKMTAKYGPLYFVGTIPKGTYAGVDTNVSVAAVTNLLLAHERMDEELAYRITRALHEHQPELVAVHQAAKEISLKSAVVGSPVPFHPGALRFYKEKGIAVPGAR